MKKFIKNIALLFLVILFTGFSLHLAAQKTGGVKGFVHNQETGEPVLFANVFLMGTTLGSVSNDDGYFIITEVPVGVYTLRATYVGFDSVVRMIEIKEGTIENIHIDLSPRKDILGKFTLEGDRTTDLTETKTSVIKVTPKQIDRIPSIGGQSDIAQFLQVVPGIVSTGDQGGQLYIRGGSPIQNKVLLDGMVIYNPFHSIGLFSVFDNEIIQTADIYTGGFNAEYGGRISSVMDIRTRDGNKRTLAGNANISTFGAKVMLEGPLRKSRDIDKSNTSFILSAKHSYLEEASNLLYEYVSDNGLPFNYTDLYGKMSINSDNGSKVNFFGFNFNDRVSYEALSDYQWNSYGIGTNFIAIPASSPVLIKGNFAFSNYFTSVEDESSTPKSSEITGFNMGLHFTNVKGNNNNSYGIEILGFKTNFQITNIANRVIDQVENTTEMAFYYKYKWSKGKFIIEPGFRGHYYASLSNFSPEPRISAKYLATGNIRIKMAAGYYAQNLIAANSDRDVVNLFYGFLSGTENLQSEFEGKPVKQFLQKARHVILGTEIDIAKRTRINIEGYLKVFDQLTTLNRNKIYDDRDADYSHIPDYLKKDMVIEKGHAEGVDLSFNFDNSIINIWFVYSLGFVSRTEDLNGYIFSYTPHYDRRHNINFVGSVLLGKKRLTELSLRWNYGSGFPFTPTAGFYEMINFSQGINTDFLTQNGELGYFFGDVNSRRLPDYHRLDASVKQTVNFGKKSTIDLIFSITNIYSRDNIFYFDRIRYERVNQLPFLPSFGVKFDF